NAWIVSHTLSIPTRHPRNKSWRRLVLGPPECSSSQARRVTWNTLYNVSPKREASDFLQVFFPSPAHRAKSKIWPSPFIDSPFIISDAKRRPPTHHARRSTTTDNKRKNSAPSGPKRFFPCCLCSQLALVLVGRPLIRRLETGTALKRISLSMFAQLPWD
ncbi:hypothetical protein LCGC14_1113940, partial [marine sediment metagenome]